MRRLPLFLLLLLALASCQPDTTFEAAEAVFQTGDDRRWATPRYDDSSWRAERGPTGNQVFWVRHRVTLLHRDSVAPLGLRVHAFGGFEVYWDGTRIGHNGRPAGPARAEVPGTAASTYLVPDSLAQPGPHLLTLRCTQAYLGHDQRTPQLVLGSYPRLLRDPLLLLACVNLMAGALLTAAAYYLFLFLAGRRKAFGSLVFSLICALCFALLMVEYAKFYIDIPYPRFYVRLEIIGLLTFAIAWLVPLYFAIQFELKRKGLLTSALFAVLGGIYLVHYHEYDLTALRLSQAAWVASLLLVLWAVRQRASGSVLVLSGLLASAVSHYFLEFDFSLYIAFTILVLCMLYLHAIRVRATENERQAALLLSSRLKLELLKKNIQPHFIKNTLTSLLDWVEESPAQSVVFIQALAREFDLLNGMAEATLISVRQEIELCENHLRVMQFRKEISYELEHTGIEPDDLIPPAIFHTVLENGITHSLPPADGRIRFQLSFKRTGRQKKYQLLTRAQPRPAETGGKAGSGTGFRYIAARLQESYGAGWTFHSAAVPEGWLTTITIAPTPASA